MADQEKSRWWSSVPGMLTAATGFVAALSGLVAGLNQLGVFRRDPEPVARVEVGVAPRESVPLVSEEHTATAPPDEVSPPARAPVASGTPVPRPAPTRPAPAPAPTRPPAAGAVLPSGTELEVATAARVCAPASGQRRFTALVTSPVRVGRATALAAGTPVVLRVRRDDSPSGAQVRLDSLVLRGSAVAVRRSQLTVPRGSARDGCLRPGARMQVTLAAPVTLPSP